MQGTPRSINVCSTALLHYEYLSCGPEEWRDSHRHEDGAIIPTIRNPNAPSSARVLASPDARVFRCIAPERGPSVRGGVARQEQKHLLALDAPSSEHHVSRQIRVTTKRRSSAFCRWQTVPVSSWGIAKFDTIMSIVYERCMAATGGREHQHSSWCSLLGGYRAG